MWRECKKCEEDLVTGIKELGIELQFNLSQGLRLLGCHAWFQNLFRKTIALLLWFDG
jgi:hypothetical protein